MTMANYTGNSYDAPIAFTIPNLGESKKKSYLTDLLYDQNELLISSMDDEIKYLYKQRRIRADNHSHMIDEDILRKID